MRRNPVLSPSSFLSAAWQNSGGFLYFPLTILSWVYALLCRSRVFLYDTGILKKKKAACLVVSIGNLTVGGTGKTPLTIYLAEQWQKRGLSVGIVSRGYRKRSKKAVVLVSDGRGPLESPATVGDEPYFMAKRLAGIPIVVAAERHTGCKKITSAFKPDLILLDDGFQHLRLERDLNILLLDASRPFGNGFLLPRGPLRESASAVRRADLLIFTRAAPDLDLEFQRAQAENLGKPVLFSRFEVLGLKQALTNRKAPISALKGQSVLAFCGIANPESFFRQLSGLGAEIKEALVFEDHHPYHEADFRKIRQASEACKAEWVLTTEKDAVKLEGQVPEGFDCWVLQITLIPQGSPQDWEKGLFGRLNPPQKKHPKL